MSKCAPYVPPLDTTWRFPTSSDPNRCILITRKSTKETQSLSTYTLSELDIQASDHSSRRQVYHYELLDWPDHGVPADPSSLTTLIRDVHHQHAQLDPSLTEPVLVHCSAGVGRTGTFISLSALLHQMSDLKQAISQNNWPQEINPVDVVVDKIRDQRVMMVQTLQQLLFVRMAFKEAWLADAVAAQLTDPGHT